MKKALCVLLMAAALGLLVCMAAAADGKGLLADKEVARTLRLQLLEARKAALGSVPAPMDIRSLAINRSRSGQSRPTSGTERYNHTDEEADIPLTDCTGSGSARALGTIPAGDEDWYCLDNLCPGSIIQIDIDSHKEGAPTDTFLEAYEDCEGGVLACRDDGNGFSGVTTDSCLMLMAPPSGKLYFKITNLADMCVDPDGGDCSYEVNVTINSALESEDNSVCPGEDLLSAPAASFQSDEMPDTENLEPEPCTREANEAVVSGSISQDGDVDNFNVCLTAGEVLLVNVEAGKCNNQCDGDLFDPLLTLSYFDPITQDCTSVVAVADNTDDLDPALKFTASKSGMYVLGIKEFSGTGKPDNVYTINAMVMKGTPDAGDTCEDGTCLDSASDCPCNGFRNHGGYVVCVVRAAKTMLREGTITQQEFAAMVSDAAQSDCSQPDIHSGKGDHSGWDGQTKNKDIPKPPHP